jgi:hypothetical protein
VTLAIHPIHDKDSKNPKNENKLREHVGMEGRDVRESDCEDEGLPSKGQITLWVIICRCCDMVVLTWILPQVEIDFYSQFICKSHIVDCTRTTLCLCQTATSLSNSMSPGGKKEGSALIDQIISSRLAPSHEFVTVACVHRTSLLMMLIKMASSRSAMEPVVRTRSISPGPMLRCLSDKAR